MTEDGQCYDEMNRNLWVATFNILMQARSACVVSAAVALVTNRTELELVHG